MSIGVLTDERIAELLNNRASSTVVGWDYEMRCAMLATIAARDEEIVRLRETVNHRELEIAAVATNCDTYREAQKASQARVAQLEAALRKAAAGCRNCGGKGFAGTHDVECFWCRDTRAALETK